MKNVDEVFYLYLIEHNKKFDHYVVKCEFKLLFNDYEFCPHITSKLSFNKRKITLSKLLKAMVDDLEDKGYVFNHIERMDIITFANKRYMAFDFYLQYNMCAFEWKLNQIINKKKSLFNNFPQTWRHPLNRYFERYRY